MRILWRVLLAVLGVLGVGLIGALLFVGYAFWASQPRYEGMREVAGLESEVKVVFSEEGVPHVFGESEADVFYGLGYLHASERFFQMDMLRRFVAGRLSEVLGPMTARVDARSRQRGFPELRDQVAAGLSPTLRAGLEAYARGVNARLAEGTPSPEHRLFFAPVEPWRVEDSMAVVVYMGNDLVSGLSRERARAELRGVLTPPLLEEFFPDYPEDAPTTLWDSDLVATGSAAQDAETIDGPIPGSNAWVVAGSRSKTGAPLLANDPHLGLGIPSIWYFARLALPTGDVVGATVPGAPLMVLGRNEHLAWGFTNTGFDVEDLFHLDEAEVGATETQTVQVRFGDPVEVTVERTPHGYVLSPEYFPGISGRTAWRSALSEPDNRAPDGIYQMMRAPNAKAFVESGRLWTAPMQNMLYATVDGHIGYTTAGKLPLRDADGEWEGFVPFEGLPRTEDPERGYILTANNAVVPKSYPYPVSGRYDAYRATRLREGLEAEEKHSFATFARLQSDVRSALAQRLLPALLSGTPKTEAGKKGQALLVGWDGTLALEEPQGLVYAELYRALHEALLADELGVAFPRRGYPQEVLLEEILVGSKSAWCNDVDTTTVETCPERVGLALDQAMETLVERHGSAMETWRWGDAHEAIFAHSLMSKLPLLGSIYEHRVPVGGDDTTLDVGGFGAKGPFETRHAASMRAIYDLSDLDRSRFVHAPGQSGHPLSPHFSDLLPRWEDGTSFEIPTAVGPDSAGRVLTLRPASP